VRYAADKQRYWRDPKGKDKGQDSRPFLGEHMGSFVGSDWGEGS
jgi:hypothetical protein